MVVLRNAPLPLPLRLLEVQSVQQLRPVTPLPLPTMPALLTVAALQNAPLPL